MLARAQTLAVALILFLGAGAALAQSYPARPVRIIVPFVPGGGLDIIARLVAPSLTEGLGKSIVIDNRPGASGAIGLELTARATPDGHTLIIFSASIPFLVPQIRSRGLRPLGVTSTQRMTVLPEVPTMIEAGIPGFVVTQWHALLAPAGTPRSVLERLHREIAGALQQPDVAQRLANDGTERVGSPPRQFAAYLEAERERWAQVIKQAGIRAE